MHSGLAGDAALLVGAALLTLAAVLSRFAERFRAPALLLFLGLGMLIGTDGLGLIHFDDPLLAQRIGVAALVVILFEGGTSTSVADLRTVLAPASVLATVGVLVTGAVVAVVVVLATDTDPMTAAMIGAVVASTDAAAVFAVLRRAPVPRRLASLLEAESGGNDPIAVLATIGVITVWQGGATAGEWVVFGVVQLVGGLAVGALVGGSVAWVLRSSRADSSTFHPVLALGAAGLAYGLAAVVGASGLLAVYLTGLFVGAASPRHRRVTRKFFEGLATLAQITLFLMLGLFVFPNELVHVEVVVLGLVAAVALVFVARPIAAALCLPWFGFSPREVAFASWAGLRGAVPIVLATIPLTEQYPDGLLVFDAVFFVVLVSASVQGLTIEPVARRLGLAGRPTGGDVVADVVPLDVAGVDVVELELEAAHAVVGLHLREAPLPGGARVGAILRARAVEVPDGDTMLAAGDLLIVVAPSHERLDEELTAWARGASA